MEGFTSYERSLKSAHVLIGGGGIVVIAICSHLILKGHDDRSSYWKETASC